jgi:uncharacterized protein (TIRG00374 family)
MPRSRARSAARTAVLLAIAGVSIYLLLPSLLAVFGSWRSLTHLDWRFGLLVLPCEVASYLCLWELDRIALHTRAWFPVVTAQLSGNLVGRILPGGGATATAFSASMLRKAGIETGEAVAAFGASGGLQLATTLALPVLALPAIAGGAPVDHSLATAAYLGIALLVVLLTVATATFVSDKPLEIAGRAIQWLLNATVRRRHHVTGLSKELLADRDFIRTTLGDRWKRALLVATGNTGFDYLALLVALLAVGANPRPSLVLLAYTAAELLALIPLTPGGLGFVEAGLTGMLVLAGVPGRDALAATLLYRLVSYWLPLPAGAIAYVLFRRRYDGLPGSARSLMTTELGGAAGRTPISGQAGRKVSTHPRPEENRTMAAELSHNHRDTLEKIFSHSSSGNIEWREVLSLLDALGATTRLPNGKLRVELGPETEIFQPPHEKDIDEQMLVDLRRMLANAGFAPPSG